MPVGLELYLEERREDRVVVSLCLSPGEDGSLSVDGAALQLEDADGEAICPRLLLPVAGPLTATLATTVELRADGTVPEGAQVVAVVWWEGGQHSARIPAEPSATLAAWLDGGCCDGTNLEDVELRALDPMERQRLGRAMPWLFVPRSSSDAPPIIELRAEERTDVDDFVDDLGLDDDAADWVRDLLNEP